MKTDVHAVLKTEIWVYIKNSFSYVKQCFSYTVHSLGDIFTPQKYSHIAVFIKSRICIQKRLHRWIHPKLCYICINKYNLRRHSGSRYISQSADVVPNSRQLSALKATALGVAVNHVVRQTTKEFILRAIHKDRQRADWTGHLDEIHKISCRQFHTCNSRQQTKLVKNHTEQKQWKQTLQLMAGRGTFTNSSCDATI